MLRKICLCLSVLGAVACSPRDALDQFLKDQHFIPFNNPTESFRVGTLLHGSANDPQPVGNPKDGARLCFPDRQPPLRYLDDVVLGNLQKSAEFEINADINPVIAAGNDVLTFKVGANAAHKVDMEFSGAEIEYLDEDAFWDYYATEMSAKCKAYLHKKGYGFIGRALRIEGMKFTFLDQAGGKIDLTINLAKVVDIKAGVNWKLSDNYTLIVDTPKYIGYQMARIVDQGGGTEGLQYAKSIDWGGNWDYQDIDPRLESLMLQLRDSSTAVPAEPL